jgi:hypothetical protein
VVQGQVLLCMCAHHSEFRMLEGDFTCLATFPRARRSLLSR